MRPRHRELNLESQRASAIVDVVAQSNEIPAWVDIVVKLTPAVFALVVGGLGAWIAHLQYRLNKDRLRLDLMSKRQEAYESLQKHFQLVLRDGQVKPETLGALHEARVKSRFLFGADLAAKFDELWKNAATAHTLHIQMYDGQGGGLPVGPERTRVAKEHTEKIQWHLEQIEVVNTLYAKYLQFDHGRG
jgi:hypothetical protein